MKKGITIEINDKGEVNMNLVKVSPRETIMLLLGAAQNIVSGDVKEQESKIVKPNAAQVASVNKGK